MNRLEFMTARLLTTTMGILLLMFAFSFTAAAKNWNQDGKVTDYGSWGIPYNAQPILIALLDNAYIMHV